MADVNIIPKIQCDNCGYTEEKHKGQFDKTYRKPTLWGSCGIEGGRDVDSYGLKSKLVFGDLCPSCANIVIEAAAEALKAARGGDA